ncbi:hypothetical protein [Microbacterium allomyrinae]|uniref:Uncharacterized protein n=1 Tax=Microbacterium allomyrinae TaxID=2830666 RepID=A0A9X1LTA3_9MICO|nr:hypothetical protein [Microbacterium allomyrinae]MCC2031412.1 hypothetical protein [Microbacterium allomyrinae]
MKLLTNGTGTYLTGDLIADEVVSLGVALSNAQRVDAVEIPFRAAHGGVEQAVITIGWQTHVNAESQSITGDELVDHGAVRAIVAQKHRLEPSGDTPMSAEEIGHAQGYDDVV